VREGESRRWAGRSPSQRRRTTWCECLICWPSRGCRGESSQKILPQTEGPTPVKYNLRVLHLHVGIMQVADFDENRRFSALDKRLLGKASTYCICILARSTQSVKSFVHLMTGSKLSMNERGDAPRKGKTRPTEHLSCLFFKSKPRFPELDVTDLSPSRAINFSGVRPLH
jgi:hypothetical protein